MQYQILWRKKPQKTAKPQQIYIFKTWVFLFAIWNIDFNDCLKFLRDHHPTSLLLQLTISP